MLGHRIAAFGRVIQFPHAGAVARSQARGKNAVSSERRGLLTLRCSAPISDSSDGKDSPGSRPCWKPPSRQEKLQGRIKSI